GTGVLTLLFPIMLGNHWYVLLLCVSFALILIASLRFNLLKSINAIDRISYGSLLYPLAVYSCYLVYHVYSQKTGAEPESYIYFYLPILTLAICDPVAAAVGKRYPFGKFKIGKGYKTLAGSLAFFISSFVLTFILFYYFESYATKLGNYYVATGIIAVGASAIEAVSGKGVDNFTIPAIVTLLLIYFS
ncbi:MAG: hypothetical protein ACK4ND_15800, partial [Cytophagaceae bacterium]